MQYIQVTFSFTTIEEYQKDLLVGELAEIGYNTFEDTADGFAAFIDYNEYSQEALSESLVSIDGVLEYNFTITEIAAENWNEEWEKNFEPVVIDGLLEENAPLVGRRHRDELTAVVEALQVERRFRDELADERDRVRDPDLDGDRHVPDVVLDGRPLDV